MRVTAVWITAGANFPLASLDVRVGNSDFRSYTTNQRITGNIRYYYPTLMSIKQYYLVYCPFNPTIVHYIYMYTEQY